MQKQSIKACKNKSSKNVKNDSWKIMSCEKSTLIKTAINEACGNK